MKKRTIIGLAAIAAAVATMFAVPTVASATGGPEIQDYISCNGGAFVLDNSGGVRAVSYVVQGAEFVVPAGEAIHTDADGTLLQPLDGIYTVTAGDREWTFPTAGNCPTDESTNPTDESTNPTEEPSSNPSHDTDPKPGPTPVLNPDNTESSSAPTITPESPKPGSGVAPSQRTAQTCQQAGPNVKTTDRNLDADGDGIGCETRGVAPVPTPIRTEAKFTG